VGENAAPFSHRYRYDTVGAITIGSSTERIDNQQ
jgi:hypothetical protein